MGGSLLSVACGPRHVRHATITESEGDDAGTDVVIVGGMGDEAGVSPPDTALPDQGSGGTGGTSPPDARHDLAPPDARSVDLGGRDLPADLPGDPRPPDLAPDLPPPDVTPGPDFARGLVAHWKFDEGTGTTTIDASGKENTGILTNGVMWTMGAPFPMSGNALSFDGTDDFVALRQNLAPVLGNTATLAFWIRTTQKGDAVPHTAPGVTGVEEGNGSNDVFWGFLDANGGIGVAAGNGVGVHSDPINDDKWHHVALTRDSGNGRVEVFVEGKLVRTGSTVAGAKSTAFTSLGRITNAGSLRAVLDDMRVWDRVLAAPDISYLATH
jgi:hypothetical protein